MMPACCGGGGVVGGEGRGEMQWSTRQSTVSVGVVIVLSILFFVYTLWSSSTAPPQPAEPDQAVALQTSSAPPLSAPPLSAPPLSDLIEEFSNDPLSTISLELEAESVDQSDSELISTLGADDITEEEATVRWPEYIDIHWENNMQLIEVRASAAYLIIASLTCV